MKYRQLGQTKIKISETGFGCMSLGHDSTLNLRLIQEALDLGINYFDTADIYQDGNNELQLGAALKGNRKAAVISTKVGHVWSTVTNGWTWNPSAEHILKAVDESLKRLQTDYIDLYMLHGGTLQDPSEQIIDTFETLMKNGKIRSYGLSSIRPSVIQKYVGQSKPSAVMMQYSLLDRRPEESSIPFLSNNQVSVLARGSLAKGLLAGKAPADFLNFPKSEVAQGFEKLLSLSGPRRTAGQTALRFVLSQEAVGSAVVGIRTIDQLREAASTSETPALSDDELAALQNLFKVQYYTEHR